MNPATRIFISVFIRLGLIFFAGWFAIADSALPEDVPLVSRLAFSFLFLIAAILVGETATLRMHFSMMLGAIRQITGGAIGGEGDIGQAVSSAVAQAVSDGDAVARDPRDSIDILIRALAADDAETRQKAHAHLMRLTGQDLPEDLAAWQAWWSENREGFLGG